MSIELTDQEFSELFDLVYIGEWIINSHDASPSSEDAPYSETVQKIYAAAEDHGCEDLVDQEDDEGNIFPAAEYEESGIHEYIDNYEDKVFWGALASRLAFRDIGSPPNTQDEATLEDYMDTVREAEDMWLKEFELNGLSRLTLRKDS